MKITIESTEQDMPHGKGTTMIDDRCVICNRPKDEHFHGRCPPPQLRSPHHDEPDPREAAEREAARAKPRRPKQTPRPRAPVDACTNCGAVRNVGTRCEACGYPYHRQTPTST